MSLIARELVPDLAQLDDLTEDSILGVLQARYDRDIIYTRIQDILISINPRKSLPIYDETAHTQYSLDRLEVKESHVFEVAAKAYRRLRETDTNQVVIVSGESGAGKTQNTGYMVRHIVHMCQDGDMALHNKIVEVNPLLELFGNAKTTMNHNSSRFAKYLEIGFTDEGRIAGATVRDYMLEKSRVVHQNPGEGNFHIFYALFAGCPKQTRENLHIDQKVEKYRIMKSDPDSLKMVETYREKFNSNMYVLEKINVDTDVLLAMLAGLIHITEIDFKENKQGAAEIIDVTPYRQAFILLDLDEEEFSQGLMACKKMFNGETVVTFKSVTEARNSRDALAKVLYERIFGWLVRQINQELHPDRKGNNLTSIGILDIAGFEKLHKNSFEQLLINLVNEKLQNFMNDLIFNIEMNIYREEGIQLKGIKFENNDDTLELLEVEHHGILMTLDEMSNFKQGSDKAFVMEIKTKFAKHKRFHEPKGDLPSFSIQHFADLVTYDADGFIEKNRDRLNKELMECMKHSKDDFIADLFTVKKGPTGTISETKYGYRKSQRVCDVHANKRPKQTATGAQLGAELGKSLTSKYGDRFKQPKNGMTLMGPSGKQHTLTSYFTQSLMQLLTKLKSADPFYVRCLKANTTQNPDKFEVKVVRDQMRYNGLAEVAKIRKMGYAVRKAHTDFLKRYRWITTNRDVSNEALIYSILMSCPVEFHRAFRIGKSKVFMTDELGLFLEHLLYLREKKASRTISRWVRQAVAERRRREEQERQRRDFLPVVVSPAPLVGKEETQRRINENRNNAADEGRKKETAEIKTEQDGMRRSVDLDRLKEKTEGDDQGHVKCSPFETVDVLDLPQPGPSIAAGVQFPSSHNDSERTNRKELEDERTVYCQADGTAAKSKKAEVWDLSRIVAHEHQIMDMHERRSLRLVKLITYAITFALVLCCAVSQKISLMVLASAQYDRKSDRTYLDSKEDSVIAAGRHFLMTVAILIPYALTFISSFFKWIFGNLPKPSIKTVVLCWIVETLHTCGLCTLCFLVLPELDMARGILLMSCVAVFPAFFTPVCTSQVKHGPQRTSNIPASDTSSQTINGSQNTSDQPAPDTASQIRDGSQRLRNPSGSAPSSQIKHAGREAAFRRIGAFALDIFAILIMVAFIPIVLLTNPSYFLDESSIDNSTREVLFVFCSLIFISLQWWENFVDDKFCGLTSSRPRKSFILSVKFDLQESRPIVSFIMSFWKICLTSLISWLYRSFLSINTNSEQRNIADICPREILDKLADMPITMNAAILTLTLAAFVGNYAGSVACKLQMQVFSFSVPLWLSIPVSVLIVVLECSDTFSLLGMFTDERAACLPPDTYTEDYYWLHYVYGAAVWLTLYWICRHIFSPTTERLAKNERLFMNPYYCGILFEQNFILGRKRHNRKVHRYGEKGQFSFRLSHYDSRIDENGEERDNDDNNNDDVNDDRYRSPNLRSIPMIYACATMWHENRQEMLQIMKSIFRYRKRVEPQSRKKSPLLQK